LRVILVLCVAVFASGQQSQLPFVLVHGALTGLGAWDAVLPHLNGVTSVLPILAGHYGNTTQDPGTITLQTYVDQVIAAANSLNGKVIIAGHSFAGLIISETAQQIPNKVAGLVYCAAYLPAVGGKNQSLVDLITDDTDSQFLRYAHTTPTYATLSNASIFTIGCEVNASSILPIISGAREPLVPITTDITDLTSGAYGSIPKFYVSTTLDIILTPGFQKKLISRTPIQKLYTVTSPHAIQTCAGPDLGADLLDVRSILLQSTTTGTRNSHGM